MRESCRTTVGNQTWAWAILLLAGQMVLGGCEVDSWLFDPSEVGHWERTPIVLPILDKLDVIDEPQTAPDVTSVRPEDLVAEVSEYSIGPSDLVTVTVFELLEQGIEYTQTRRVDELGLMRLPILGPIEAKGKTASQLEGEISDTLVARDLMREPAVSVIIQEARQRTFSLIGEPRQGGVAIGTYPIPRSDFRLLDVIAMVRGIPGQTKKLHIIRQVSLKDEVIVPSTPPADHQTPSSSGGGSDPLLGELFKGLDDEGPTKDQKKQAQPASQGTEPEGASPGVDPLSTGLEGDRTDAPFVNVNGKWVRAKTPGTGQMPPGTSGGEETPPAMTQRIIEIPYALLREGDMRYNVVIRPGDVVSVPAPAIGFCYIGGQIARPGTFSVPGDRDLTLRQLIFAAGGLNGLAIPERVELTRRIGLEHAAIVRVNARAIFNGSQPDIFIKPNDTINIGTNFFALPLAVVRNGFRMTYGFGFVLDRNFNLDVFGRGF